MRKSKTYSKHELKKKNQTIKDAFLFDLATWLLYLPCLWSWIYPYPVNKMKKKKTNFKMLNNSIKLQLNLVIS